MVAGLGGTGAVCGCCAIWTWSTLTFRDVEPPRLSKCKGTAVNRNGTHLIGKYLGVGKNDDLISFHIQRKKGRRGHKMIAIKFLANFGKWALIIKLNLIQRNRGCCIKNPGEIPANCAYFR